MYPQYKAEQLRERLEGACLGYIRPDDIQRETEIEIEKCLQQHMFLYGIALRMF